MQKTTSRFFYLTMKPKVPEDTVKTW